MWDGRLMNTCEAGSYIVYFEQLKEAKVLVDEKCRNICDIMGIDKKAKNRLFISSAFPVLRCSFLF